MNAMNIGGTEGYAPTKATCRGVYALLAAIVVSSLVFSGSGAFGSSSTDEADQANSASAPAKNLTRFRDFVPLSNGTKIWVEAEIISPAKPTRLILNGLTNSASYSFGQLSSEFISQGTNVIRFDFAGQAKTLIENLPMDSRTYGHLDQVRDLVELIGLLKQRLSLTGPMDILGQSYGGGIILSLLADEPRFAEATFRTVTVYAPYTEVLRTQHEQILNEIKFYRVWYPWMTLSDSELYDMIFRRTVMTTYWAAEPEIIGITPAHTYLHLEGVIRLATGMRSLNSIQEIPRMAHMVVNVVMSASDQYIPSDVIPRFWEALPVANRGVFVKVFGVEHKMFQAAPAMTARLMELTAHLPASIPLGSKLEAHVFTNNVYLDGKNINDL